MGNDTDRMDERRIAEEASAWVSRLTTRTRTELESEYGDFFAWLKTSPVHVREFLIASAIDQALDSLPDWQRLKLD